MIASGDPIRLALIGAGAWGRNIIRTADALDGVDLTCVVSRNASTPELVGEGCVVCDDWRRALKHGQVDGVIIATPPSLHFEMTREAVRRGIPVLVEKPFTMDLAQAASLVRAARDSRCLVMVDHIHLFGPAYRELKKRVARAGAVRAIRAIGGNFGPFRPDVPVLWDWGPHDVAMCVDLLGMTPEEVDAEWVERRESPRGVGEVIELRLTFPRGIEARCRIGNLIRPKRRYFAVHLESEVIIYDDLAPAKLTLHAPSERLTPVVGRGKTIELPGEQLLANVIEAFAMAIRAGERDSVHLDLGLDVVSVLSSCERILSRAGVTRTSQERSAGSTRLQ